MKMISVSLFNGVSTLVGYVMHKAVLIEYSSGTIQLIVEGG